MSFDLYFQPAVHGELLEISRSDLRSLFPIIEEESQADYWSIRYECGERMPHRSEGIALRGRFALIFTFVLPCGKAVRRSAPLGGVV